MRLSNPRRHRIRSRKVTISSAGRAVIRSTARLSTSRLVGSAQCASSKIISTGLERANASMLCRECVQRSLPALMRRQLERGIASIVGQRHHLGKERRILGRGRGLREHRIELVEPRLRVVVVRQSSGAFHLADDRIKCAVRVLRGAEIAQARVRLGSEAFQQRSREP